MGVLVDGAWRDGELPQETGTSGEFRRADSRFRERIPADGSRVICRALNGPNRTVLQNFLFGQALSFALVLQGREPLHAASVQVDGAAIGCWATAPSASPRCWPRSSTQAIASSPTTC